MPKTELRLIRRCAEYRRRERIDDVPPGIRGIYVLLKHRPQLKKFDVVYIGLARNSVRRRLRIHDRSKKKRDLWTHFSVFEVFDNIRDEEIEELEGLLRHLFRRDTRASRLNVQRSYKKLARVRSNDLDNWWDE